MGIKEFDLNEQVCANKFLLFKCGIICKVSRCYAVHYSFCYIHRLVK